MTTQANKMETCSNYQKSKGNLVIPQYPSPPQPLCSLNPQPQPQSQTVTCIFMEVIDWVAMHLGRPLVDYHRKNCPNFHKKLVWLQEPVGIYRL